MRILFIIHAFPPGSSGGTETYTREIATALAATPGNRVAVVTREADAGRPQYCVRREELDGIEIFRINNTFEACGSFEETYTNPALLNIAADVIGGFDPDVVHIQHLTCLSAGLPRQLAAMHLPVVMTLHDYWMMCHRGQLFDLDGRRCAGPYDEGCDRCLPAVSAAGTLSWRAGHAIRSLSVPGVADAVRLVMRAADAAAPAASARASSLARLECMQEAASHIDLFLAPSQTIADHFQRFGVTPSRIRRRSQGVDLTRFRPAEPARSSCLRIGFAGAFLPTKAPHILLEAVRLLPQGSVTVDLVGETTSYHGEDTYRDVLAPLLASRFVRRVGPAPHDRMPDLLSEIDVLVVPSIWIENAPIVIQEAFAIGIPVVASDLGGMAEAVTHGRNGLLFEAGNPQALAAQLRRLLDEPGLLAQLRAGIAPPRSLEDDVAELSAIYEELLRARTKPLRPSEPELEEVVVDRPAAVSVRTGVTAVILNYNTADDTWLAVRSLQTSFAPPDRIVVVDNGSSDRSADQLRQMLPDLTIVETGRNLGFPGGCNAGIREALEDGAERVLLVNSDAVLAPDAIGILLAASKADATAGILGPALLSRSEPGRLESAGISYSMVTGRMLHRDAGRHVSALPDGLRDVDAVSGCVMLLTRAVLEQVGLFREDYFYSFEDLDLCLRARSAGFRSCCVPAARAYHQGHSSIGRRSARRLYFATRNHLKVASEANGSGGVAGLARGGWIVGLNAAYAVTSADAPLIPGLAAVIRGAWHHVRGRYGPD
jgi:GT2 family glycosyltransferase/glycosyltransferase involved in cell wall biosynthesis